VSLQRTFHLSISLLKGFEGCPLLFHVRGNLTYDEGVATGKVRRSVADFKDEIDLDGRIEGQDCDANGNPRVSALLTEDFGEKL
jgi:hypothetical protein